MLGTVELNGIQANWRTDELGALNERLAAFGTMRVRHLSGRYEKIDTLQISEKGSRNIKFGPPKKLMSVEEYYLREDVIQLEHPTDRRTGGVHGGGDATHIQAQPAPAPVIPHLVPAVLPRAPTPAVVPVLVPAVLPPAPTFCNFFV